MVRVVLSAGLMLLAGCAPQVAPRHASDREAVVAEAKPLLDGLALSVDGKPPPAPPPPMAPAMPGAVAAAPAFTGVPQSLADADRAVDCLTAAIYYEARSEPLDGQRAVAQVVLNRVRDRAFPASVCGVVFQGSERRTGCQFTFTCDGSLAAPRDPAAWARSRIVAQAALDGNVYAPIGSATHYHTRAVSPWWAPSLTEVAAVGSHIFYRWRGALEQALAFRQRYAGTEPGVPPATVVTAAPLPGDKPLPITVAGVTIHRPSDGAAAVAVAQPAPAVTQAASAPELFVGGVRVHRGRTTAPGVTVSEATAPAPISAGGARPG